MSTSLHDVRRLGDNRGSIRQVLAPLVLIHADVELIGLVVPAQVSTGRTSRRDKEELPIAPDSDSDIMI